MKRYDHKTIEKRWQRFWTKHKIYTTADRVPGKDNFHLLVEFPYPSGNLHVGHWYAFAVPDILARTLRMQGKNVLYPIGFDAFGLPAENAAIKHGLNPRTWTEKNIAYMTKQIESMGTSFDWSRELSTIDPGYYKWTQWLFLQLYKKGLAYQKETAVNWCPKDKTVLANEQVVNGRCERCDSEVVQKQMLQWNVKITDYADRLIDDLASLDWPEQIKEAQRNWIGRSEGAEIDFPLEMAENGIKRFVLLHGKGGSPETNFLPWMREKLEHLGYEVQVPTLPDSAAPDDEVQAEYVRTHCRIDEHTTVVGHSFGGIVALRLLESGVRMGRLVLVGTPYSDNFIDKKKRPTISAAVRKGFAAQPILRNAAHIELLYDTRDHVVPLSDGEAFAQLFNRPLIKRVGRATHFCAEREPEVLRAALPSITVFTTRPDTLFGATYLVLAPEHPFVHAACAGQTCTSKSEVETYVKAAARKTELERQTDQKEKTGVELRGVKAINPATGEAIPIYAADYVLPHYGTGAIMAVPAHDERDHEFAKKFDLPIKQVVEPVFVGNRDDDRPKQDVPFVERVAINAIVKHWAEDKYLILDWKEVGWHTFITGGVKEGQTPEEAARCEVREETGYKNMRLVRQLSRYHSKFFHTPKQVNRFAHFESFLFELIDNEQDPVSGEEQAKHISRWVSHAEVESLLTSEGMRVSWREVLQPGAYVGDGILGNSDAYTGLSVEEAKRRMTEMFGESRKTYRLRDWIVSRQRYWGVPIPIVHCPTCGIVSVPDKDLPVKLPDVKDYLPEGSGKSPLAKVKKFTQTKCSKCKGKAERETDTLDTFVDSSWYFLRYADPKNTQKFADPKKLAKWMPVSLYSGGAEHTTMHVLYSRFWQKALYDLGLVKDAEPYTRRMNRSIILGPDGQKMSKSRGNVIDPDAEVKRLGADTVRMYLAFIGPYNEVSSYPWNPDGVVGVRRFLERIWRVQERIVKQDVPELAMPFNKAIKKVGEDITAMKFNTAIAQLMMLLNDIERAKAIGKSQWKTLLTLLAPFAPHITEELWSASKGKGSIHLQKWPSFDPKKLIADEVTVVVQINGKVRAEISVSAGAAREMVEEAARKAVSVRLAGKQITKTIVVPGRLVNFVVREQ